MRPVELGRAAIVAVAGAALLLLAACQRTEREPDLLVPGFATGAPRMARIELEQGDGDALAFVRRDGRWWIDGADWPVARGWLDPVLTGLLTARCDEPRTSRPDRFAVLGLDAPRATPPEGGAFARPTGRWTFPLPDGDVRLVVGYPHPRGGTYVRVEGAASSCYTLADFRLPATRAAWFEAALLDPPFDRPVAVGVEADGLPAVWLAAGEGGARLASPPLPGVPKVSLPAMPGDAAVVALAVAASGLRQVDVRVATEPGDAPRRLRLLDAAGSERVLELRGTPGETWVRVRDDAPRYARREFRLPPDVAAPLWADVGGPAVPR
ncbi:MAG: DUF4340 domain-containing protein [Lysobacteraceae bacterium]